MQLLQLAQQREQGFGLALQFPSQQLELAELAGESLLLAGRQAHQMCLSTLARLAPIQVVESRDIVRGIRVLHR